MRVYQLVSRVSKLERQGLISVRYYHRPQEFRVLWKRREKLGVKYLYPIKTYPADFDFIGGFEITYPNKTTASVIWHDDANCDTERYMSQHVEVLYDRKDEPVSWIPCKTIADEIVLRAKNGGLQS